MSGNRITCTLHVQIPLLKCRQHSRRLLLGMRTVGWTKQHRPLRHSKLRRSWELLPQNTSIANHLIRNIFLCARQQPLTPAEFLPAHTASIFGRENCLAHCSRKVANPSSTLKCHFLHWLTLPLSSPRDKTVTTFYSLLSPIIHIFLKKLVMLFSIIC